MEIAKPWSPARHVHRQTHSTGLSNSYLGDLCPYKVSAADLLNRSWPNIQISSCFVIFAEKMRLFSNLTTLARTTLELLGCGCTLLWVVVTDDRTVRPWAPSYTRCRKLKKHFWSRLYPKSDMVGKILSTLWKMPTKIFPPRNSVIWIKMKSLTNSGVVSSAYLEETRIFENHIFFHAKQQNHWWWSSAPNLLFLANDPEAKLASLGHWVWMLPGC